jgi:plasmid stabilization system protein ParE
MKRFKVIIQPVALDELRSACEWIAERSPESALRWYEDFIAALESLESNPKRCGLAPENGCIPAELRQLAYGKRSGCYRAIFTVEENAVRVLHIRHAARLPLRPEDFGESVV